MGEWTCPNCRGEFPMPGEVTDNMGRVQAEVCPWCKLELGEYDS